MRIPPKLHPEIISRHDAGQSDQAIADWLARLDPPVTVSRVAVLQTRQRLTGTKPTPRQPKIQAAGGKLSGAQGAMIRAARTAQEAKDHRKRGAVIIGIADESDLNRAHLYQLQVLLDLQGKINVDPFMTLPEKVRHSTSLAQAMAKVRSEAELERRLAQLEHERAAEAEQLAAARRDVEVERRRVEAERKELDDAWRKLNEERSLFASRSV